MVRPVFIQINIEKVKAQRVVVSAQEERGDVFLYFKK